MGLGVIPTVEYDDSLFNDYEQKFIMPYQGSDGPTLKIHFPFVWSNKKKCLSITISKSLIQLAAWSDNAWSSIYSVQLTANT